MKTFEQLILEAMKEEFTIILWCSWFHLLNEKYKKEIIDLFKWYSSKRHPNGVAFQFHLRDWQNPMYKQVQVDYKEDENGPKITLTNIHCTRYQAGSLLDEIRLNTFNFKHKNNMLKYLRDTVKIPIEGTRYFRDPTIDGKVFGKYDDMIKKLPELEGIF